MSDQDTNQTPEPAEQTVTAPEDTDVAQSIQQPEVSAPENALIGDDALPEPRKVEVEVNSDAVPAQVTGAPAKPVDTVYVHETSVELDHVITDPNSPEAVQIPDAGRGSLVLPLHGLDGPSPEQVFAKSDDAE